MHKHLQLALHQVIHVGIKLYVMKLHGNALQGPSTVGIWC
jgi:hypothetical protein